MFARGGRPVHPKVRILARMYETGPWGTIHTPLPLITAMNACKGITLSSDIAVANAWSHFLQPSSMGEELREGRQDSARLSQAGPHMQVLSVCTAHRVILISPSHSENSYMLLSNSSLECL